MSAILILAGLQFVIAYQHVDVGTMIFRMFAVAFLEAGLAVVFFMHLGSENRALRNLGRACDVIRLCGAAIQLD